MSKRLLGLCAVVVGLILALAVALTASVMLGTRSIAPTEVLAALTDPAQRGTDIGVIVWDQRIPRTLIGVVVGAALALAGATIQGHTRNPLADPSILGISSGATFAVVFSVFLLGVRSVHFQVWFALLGAIVAAVMVFGASAAGGGGSPLTLVLAGAALTALFTALTTGIILWDRASLDQFRFWNTGSLSGRDLSVLWAVLPFLIVGIVLALASASVLNALAVGVDTAKSLGINVERARALGLLSVTLLAGAGTAAVGPIAFVGLIVPHAVRALTGPDHRWLLPCSALAGGVLVLFSDVVGRLIIWPAELQTGVVLAFVGVPVLIALVRRRNLVAA